MTSRLGSDRQGARPAVLLSGNRPIGAHHGDGELLPIRARSCPSGQLAPEHGTRHGQAPVLRRRLDRSRMREMMWYADLNRSDSGFIYRRPERQQGTPLVRDGVMFIPNPQDVIQAIDLVTGDLVWKYCRGPATRPREYMIGTLMETSRNVAIHGELLFDTTMDDLIVALDGETREVVWDTRTVRSSPTEYSAPHLRIPFSAYPTGTVATTTSLPPSRGIEIVQDPDHLFAPCSLGVRRPTSFAHLRRGQRHP